MELCNLARIACARRSSVGHADYGIKQHKLNRFQPQRGFVISAQCFSAGLKIGIITLFLIIAILPPASSARADTAAPDLSLYPTLFKRADAPTAAADAAQILMVGDTSFARGVEEATNQYGMDYPLNQVSPWLQAADLAVGNYEGVIAPDGVGKMRYVGYRLRAQPAAAPALARAGFKLLNVANNHTVDWGPVSLQTTVETLHAAGLQTVGAGPDAEAARQPVVITVRGVRLVFLSFTMVPDPPDYDRDRDNIWTRSWFGPTFARDKLAGYIKAALPLGDAVIVQFHWGNEYVPCPLDWQIDLARAAIYAGATLVVGHHPHIVQPFEKFGNGFIAYSLGNFLFDQPRTPGLGLWIRIDKKGLIDVHGLPLRPGVHPEWFAPDKAAAQLRGLCPLNKPRATAFSFEAGHYAVRDVPVSESALPGNVCAEHPLPTREIGRIDMKGDGETERVTLSNGTLHVFEGEREVYTSHPSWQVVDASLGDPNQDGRFEVTMLLWKQDTPGAPVTTHPFILGYRGGQYKVIWGGSATLAWVQALGVADVDGDSQDELVTIERDADASPCDERSRVVVMKWNGWGFTRQWASHYGQYNDLAFLQPEGSSIPLIVAR